MEENEMIDYEKKYNEALERAQKTTRAGGDVAMDIVQYIFPELAESEDERTRKVMIEYFTEIIDNICAEEDIKHGEKVFVGRLRKFLAYLEKQKESTWTEEDESFRKHILPRILDPKGWTMEQIEADRKLLKEFVERQKNKWVEKHKEQKPEDRFEEAREKYQVEWSDNDNQLIGFIFDLLNDLVWRKDWAMSKEECLERLKSLRTQPKVELSENVKKTLDEVSHILIGLNYKQIAKDYKQAVEKLLYSNSSWKPSEEQMEALGTVVKGYDECTVGSVGYRLKEMYKQLKKLI